MTTYTPHNTMGVIIYIRIPAENKKIRNTKESRNEIE